MEADRVGGSPRACDAGLQLARHGTQQCGRLAAVPALEDAETKDANASSRGDPVASMTLKQPPLQFTIRPVPPFRLDLTVWALRRRARNLVDRWDGTTYRRVVVVSGRARSSRYVKWVRRPLRALT